MITVDRGAKFLDEAYPGWADLIDTETLDIGDCCACVLGQIYRREHPRIRKESSRLESFQRKAVEFGFVSDDKTLDWQAVRAHGFAYGNGLMSNLNAAWTRAIKKRQSVSA